jgi:hypothetical protein
MAMSTKKSAAALKNTKIKATENMDYLAFQEDTYTLIIQIEERKLRENQVFHVVADSNRIWTADMLATRGWPRQDKCSLCDQLIETADHLELPLYKKMSGRALHARMLSCCLVEKDRKI